MAGYATLIIDESAMIGISAPAASPTVPLYPYRTFSQTMSSPAEVLKQLYSRYVGGLQAASDFLRDDLPSASPGVAKWVQETGRRACRKYARQRGSIPFLTSDPSWDGICSGYWEVINEEPTSGGKYAPPFTGGQCPGRKYQLTANGTYFINNPPPQGPSPIYTWGGTISCNDSGNILLGPISGSLGRNSQGFPNWTWKDAGGRQITQTLIANPLAVMNLSSASVTPCTGVECSGNLPSTYTPPTFPPNLPPLSPPTNPAPGFGNNWDVDILPDGQVSICIGGECSTGTPPGGGGGPDSGGGPGEPDGPPQENDPNDPDSENEITGCVEDGNILTGLRIELTDIPSGSKVTDGNYYGVCWVYMGPDSEKLDMISDGRWVYDGQFFLPDSDSCTCFKVKVRYPWGIRVQAFSRPKEE